jgi:hypothetical protein
MICTLYSHFTGFEKIIDILREAYPKATFSRGSEGGFETVEMETKGGLFSAAGKLKIAYRQRDKPSYRLRNEDVCPLCLNLKGMYGFVDGLFSHNEQVKGLLLQKITTINCEFSFLQAEGKMKNLESTVRKIANAFDAFLFAQPGTVVSRSEGQHFLDKDLRLILDGSGASEVDTISIRVESKYAEQARGPVLQDQRERRKRSEDILQAQDVPVYKNPDALFVESGTTVRIRTKDEVVDRAIALCYIEMKSEGADKMLLSDFAEKYNVGPKLTETEKDFAANDHPSEQEMVDANWRAESFHVLLWALGFIPSLDFPRALCNISADVQLLFSRDEARFRDAANLRSKEEILDAADLALRLHWACVNARVKNGQPPAGIHPGIVYERHYALNWLIHYEDQDWDDVTTDT